MTASSKKIIFVLLMLALIGIGVTFIIKRQPGSEFSSGKIPGPAKSEQDRNENPAPAMTKPEMARADFSCRDNKAIRAFFNNGAESFVDLNLSDGRGLRLSQTISASGIRYATPDESVVFWNKGDQAFINESGTVTFADCVVSDNAVLPEVPVTSTSTVPEF